MIGYGVSRSFDQSLTFEAPVFFKVHHVSWGLRISVENGLKGIYLPTQNFFPQTQTPIAINRSVSCPMLGGKEMKTMVLLHLPPSQI